MDADSKRRQVSLDQLNALLGFLKENQELAKGLSRGRRGKLNTLKLWNICAKKLNLYKDGAHKDGRGWSKYWCDWKYRVRRRALELKAAQDANRSPPEGMTALSPMEEDIMSIIGENSLHGIVIKCDPLGEEEPFVEPNNVGHNDGTSFRHYSEPEPKIIETRLRKRRHSSRDVSELNDVGSPDRTSLPPDQKPAVNLRNGEDSGIKEHATAKEAAAAQE